MLRHAIFDMDGTLLASTGLQGSDGMWDTLSTALLARWGFPYTDEDRTNTSTMTIEGTAAYYVARYCLPIAATELADEIRLAARKAYAEQTAPKPGVLQAIGILHEQGIPCCVASATDLTLVEAALTNHGLRDRFAFVLSCEAPEGKANPEVFLRAMRQLGAVSPAEVMVFEDSLTAARTAKTLGCYVVGVRDRCTEANWPALQAVADETVEDWAVWAAGQAKKIL